MQSLREQQGEIKKDFLSEHCKEIEEDDKMAKTRDFFQENHIPREYFMLTTARHRGA